MIFKTMLLTFVLKRRIDNKSIIYLANPLTLPKAILTGKGSWFLFILCSLKALEPVSFLLCRKRKNSSIPLLKLRFYRFDINTISKIYLNLYIKFLRIMIENKKKNFIIHRLRNMNTNYCIHTFVNVKMAFIWVNITLLNTCTVTFF